MKILLGPLRPFQLLELEKRFSSQHRLYPILDFSNSFIHRDRLSKHFEEAYDPGIDVVINLYAQVDIDWSKIGAPLLLGVYYHERKHVIEAISTAYEYDKVFCKSIAGLNCLRRRGLSCELIRQLPIYELDQLSTGTAEELPYVYDVCFQGNLKNDNTYEYRDRHQVVQSLWMRKNSNARLRLFIHRDYMLTPRRSAMVYRKSRVVFRDASMFAVTSRMHAEFTMKIWHYRRPVLFWYAAPGAPLGYRTLKDGFNCVVYNEKTFVEKLAYVLANETYRREIVENGYRSIGALRDEVYDDFVGTIERCLANVDTVLCASNRKKNKLSEKYYLPSTYSLSNEYISHYSHPVTSKISVLCRAVGNPYLKPYVDLALLLSDFISFLELGRKKAPTAAIELLVDLSWQVSSITLVAVQLLADSLEKEQALTRVEGLVDEFEEILMRFSRRSEEFTSPELARVFHLFPPFTGTRARKNLYEVDYLTTFHTSVGDFSLRLLNFFNRTLYETCGDVAVLCDQLEAAGLYYGKSARALEGKMEASRCELKLAFIGGGRPEIMSTARKALGEEPLNRFYAAIVLQCGIPGEGPHALDVRVFKKLVEGLGDRDFGQSLRAELATADLLQAVACLLVPGESLARYVDIFRLLKGLAASREARKLFRECLQIRVSSFCERLANVGIYTIKRFVRGSYRKITALANGTYRLLRGSI